MPDCIYGGDAADSVESSINVRMIPAPFRTASGDKVLFGVDAANGFVVHKQDAFEDAMLTHEIFWRVDLFLFVFGSASTAPFVCDCLRWHPDSAARHSAHPQKRSSIDFRLSHDDPPIMLIASPNQVMA